MSTRPPSRKPSPTPPPPSADSVSMDLYEQPGHLIRRAHQIAVGVFNEMVGPEVTTIQYAILRMVHEMPGIDQVGLARHIALDTSTTALTAARLEAKGLLLRTVADHNRRQLQLTLTPDGEELLASLVSGVHRMRQHLLDALDPAEQELFMELLRKFVHLHNDRSRAPLKMAGGEGVAGAGKRAGGRAAEAALKPASRAGSGGGRKKTTGG